MLDMAYACMVELPTGVSIAVYQRREDAQAVALGEVVEIDPREHFQGAALDRSVRIGLVNRGDQSWRDLRPLFGE